MTGLAALELAAGDDDRAAAHGERALAVHRATGHRLGDARTHLVLGHSRRRAGDSDAAHDHWRHALTLFADIGTPESHELVALLGDGGRLRQNGQLRRGRP